MAEPRLPDPVLLVVAAFSRHAGALHWARERLEQIYGEVSLTSTPFLFSQTAYYQSTMGSELHKQFFVFRELVHADRLPEIKLQTNALEKELAQAGLYPESRPINLDPGFLSLGKFSLATTKDQAHRVYLQDGIFAEVTLRFQDGTFVPWPWTYADYRLVVVVDFLNQAREFYRQRLGEEKKLKQQGTTRVQEQ
jgi:hypothetical protein